jgi:iron(III) transport system substrate-binding protein
MMLNAARTPIAALLILAGCLLLAACGQTPATSSPGRSAGASGGSVSSDWEALVAAAKREGKVSLLGPGEEAVHKVLVDPFQEQFGIPIEYVGGLSGPQTATKVTTERAAGLYNWDILIAGSTIGIESMDPINALEPIDPQLILPEVKDPKNWRGGALPVIGAGGDILVMTPYQRGIVFYNKNLVKGEEITSYKDLLAPKWKDKLQSADPRSPGPGQGTFIFFYLHPDLGADFIRGLGKQNVTLQDGYQNQVDLVGQGRTPIMIGAADNLALARIKQGAPIGIVPSTQLKEGTDVSAANGNVSLFKKAPHPNAAKLYLNWLLTKQEQELYARANGFPGARADINADWTEAWRTPQPNSIRTDGEVSVRIRPELQPVLQEAFGAR